MRLLGFWAALITRGKQRSKLRAVVDFTRAASAMTPTSPTRSTGSPSPFVNGFSDPPFYRYAIKQMMCMHCFEVQPCGQFCNKKGCEKKLAKYYCDICHLFSDADKSIFHCKDCGLCRVGKGLGIDYKHCTKCGSCINLSIFDDHVCLENALHSNCPICAEHMFTSVKPVCILKCGHYMHLQCLDEYTQRDYRCPICKKSLGDMSNRWVQIDEYMTQNPMPEEYKDKKAKILCFDCGEYSTVKYHFMYHRCGAGECGSYNTTQT